MDVIVRNIIDPYPYLVHSSFSMQEHDESTYKSERSRSVINKFVEGSSGLGMLASSDFGVTMLLF